MKTLLTLKQSEWLFKGGGEVHTCIAWFSRGMEEKFDIWGGYFACILGSSLPESRNLFSQ